MISYEQFSRIRHLKEHGKLSARQISEKTGLSKPTVLRWLNEESYRPRRQHKTASILDPYKGEIFRLVHEHRYSAQKIYQFIQDLGYEGGYTTVKEFVRKVRPKHREAFLELVFRPAEAAQVDFGECGYLEVDGVRRKLYCFTMVLCHSRKIYVEFILRQNMEHFLQCHRNAFEYFNGVTEKVMVDNCKVAVLRHSADHVVVLNSKYDDFSRHYGFSVVACGVRKGNEKGRVERGIGYVKQNFLDGYSPYTLESVNADCRDWMEKIANSRIHGTTRRKPDEMYQEEEKEQLLSLPLIPYDCAVIKEVQVSKQFKVSFESNRYSVPSKYASSRLTMHVYPANLCFYHDGTLVAEHPRSYGKRQNVENPSHAGELILQKQRARNRQLMKNFLLLCDASEAFYTGLKERGLHTLHHLKQITALAEIYPREVVTKAIESAVELHCYNSEYITYLCRVFASSPPQQTGEIHLTRAEEALDIQLQKSDLAPYQQKLTQTTQ